MLYFAYGSNLWPARLGERTPGARVVGRARLPHWRLHFHKRSDVDGSGKAGIAPSHESQSEVWGALYHLPPEEIHALDRAEGLGIGYDKRQVEIRLDAGQSTSAFTYVARADAIDVRLRPFGWYHRFVLAGAALHELPGAYLETLRAVVADRDPDVDRRRIAEAILSRPGHGISFDVGGPRRRAIPSQTTGTRHAQPRVDSSERVLYNP